jgi:hypothetical protein
MRLENGCEELIVDSSKNFGDRLGGCPYIPALHRRYLVGCGSYHNTFCQGYSVEPWSNAPASVRPRKKKTEGQRWVEHLTLGYELFAAIPRSTTELLAPFVVLN